MVQTGTLFQQRWRRSFSFSSFLFFFVFLLIEVLKDFGYVLDFDVWVFDLEYSDLGYLIIWLGVFDFLGGC